MHETQYYASSNCTHTDSETGQSDYSVSMTDACNEVHSPNAPVDDDSVAWTEFVGLSYIAGPTAAPTAAPTRRPSAVPTSAPTAAPSAAPTPNNLIHFAAQQVDSLPGVILFNRHCSYCVSYLVHRLSAASA